MDLVEQVTGQVKSAARVLDILEHLSAMDRDGISQGRLARALGIPKSSLHGLLRVLAERGYVERDPASQRYRLGPRLLGLGTAYLGGLDLYQVAQPVMVSLARLSSETITLDILHQGSMVSIAREDSPHPIQVATRIGWPFPPHATATGKVLLAALSDEELAALYPQDELPRLTDTTVRTRDELRAQLEDVRRSGAARAHGEIYEGVEAIAVPIYDHKARVIAALDALVPAHRANPAHLESVERLLRAGAGMVSARLGAPPSLGTVVRDIELYLQEIWTSDGVVGRK